MLTGYSNIISVTTDCFTGLLDLYPNAAVAYSVRKLRSAYAGAAIRVRRSSDNAEQDIGFTGTGDLDETALTAFVGSNNGFVVTWYDQSGNANNATQSTAANQAQIVNSGTVLKLNGKPRLNFDGSDFYNLTTTITANSSGNYNSFVGKRSASGSRHVFFGGNQYIFGQWSDNNIYLQNKTSGYALTSDSSAAHALFTGIADSSTQKIFKNGIDTSASVISSALNMNIDSIGAYLSVANANGDFQEGIFYNTNQSSNRSGIETNINTYYGIY